MTFWRSETDLHTTTLDPYYLRPSDHSNIGVEGAWQSVGVVCVIQSKPLIGAFKSRYEEGYEHHGQYPHEWVLKLIENTVGSERWLKVDQVIKAITSHHPSVPTLA